MREIITVQVGGCGNAIGQEFWGVICGEHGINATGGFSGTSPLQCERMNVFFNQIGQSRHVARVVAVDTDPEGIDKLRRGPLSLLFPSDNLISGTSSTGNNFAKGYDPDGELIKSVMECIRQEAENCDAVQGIQNLHSLGGGTGTAVSALIWDHLDQEYPKQIIQTASIIPSPKLSETIVEAYNCILCFPHLLDDTHLTYCMDNEALYDICVKQLGLATPTHRDANHLIAHALSGVTTCLRFPGQLNSGLRKLYVNMCPFPNLHFLVPGFAPLTSCQRVPYTKLSVPELVKQIFSPKNLLAEVDLREGKMLTVAAIFRGLISPKQIDTLMAETRNRYSDNFINWIPNNIKTAICDIPPIGLEMSATFIGNTTGFADLFHRIQKSFEAMFNRKAFLHWYTDEGIEEAQFIESNEKLSALLQEYAEAGVDIEEDDNDTSDFGQHKDE